MSVFSWLNAQLLKMQWLWYLVEQLVVKVFRLSMESRIGESVHFFIYDVIKIFILLSVMIFAISYIQSYFPPERTKRLLGGIKGIKGNILGGILGILTPFCSCSSIPIFIGFISAGLPLGATFSFLISSPMVDLAAFMLLISTFGVKIGIAYVVTGILIAIVGGVIIEKMKMEEYVESYVWGVEAGETELEEMTPKDRIEFAKGEVKDIFGRVWPYILIGVGIGAGIHNWIPQSIIEKVLGSGNPFSVLIATFIGVPIYADIFGTIPIAEALVAKGVGIGTVVAFMMGVTTMSLPSLVMLSKVIKPKLLGTFIVLVSIGIIIVGYGLNAFSALLM
ncbi:permease [Schnuerera sp. xch1]|uniref:permease n=1 Tax=Schnuerera sp. xch1 TaxID=2874283 RepID=UPI001CBB5698|nr:permease [Schnuerera sp. xch1]MBZ2174362.1 permease [Schnuerera sp. xch1]